MKIKRMVKRILTVGTVFTMLGATVMGAMAADLSKYPDLFVSDGVFNGLLVVGENAAAIDNLALTDIASSMKYKKAGAVSTVSVEGDAWKVGTSSKFLEMANSNATSSSIVGETFADINSFIGSAELDGLADGSYSTNAANYDYQQFMFFDEQTGGTDTKQNRIVKYDESDEEVTADHLFFKSNLQLAHYKLEFASTAQSDVTDADGTATTTGGYLDDFRNTDIKMLGKDFSVVEAIRPASGFTTSVKLTLMAGATHDTMLEGDTKTYTVGEKEYEVALTYVDATKAKFTVNGEATNKLAVGETYVLSDGSELGVSEVLYQAYAGGVHSAEFYLGATKLVLRDDNSTVAGGAYNMKVGSEDIDGTTCVITGTDDGTTATLSTIELNMSADDDYWVPSGGKLSEVIAAAGDESEVLFAGAFDVEYKGLAEQETKASKLKTASSKRYKLQLYDGDGNAVELPVAYAEGTYNLSFGAETQVAASRTNHKQLVLGENQVSGVGDAPVYKDDFFILTAGTAADGSAKSYLMQYKGADKVSKTSPKIKFKNTGSGETLEYSVSATNRTATIKLGGYSFGVDGSGITSDDFVVFVDMNGGGGAPAAAGNITFVDYYGAEWAFKPNTQNRPTGYEDALGGNTSAQAYIQITQTTPNADDYDNVVPSTLKLNITAAAGPETRADLYGVTLLTPDGETEVKYGYTSMGAFITHNEPSSDPDEITLVFPAKQRLPQVYVTSGATTSSTVSGGELVAVTIVDATKLDSEVASVKAQNLIVVGGPCVNTVAAELLGNPADCTEGFTPGKARVKLFEHATGNVAMLVAGYSGADTRLAGKVIAHRWAELSGTEVEVEGTTYSDATISKSAVTK